MTYTVHVKLKRCVIVSCLVLPPLLPQLIIAVAGVLTGYNGSFEFKEPGHKYEDTPYVGMRVVSKYPVWGLIKEPAL